MFLLGYVMWKHDADLCFNIQAVEFSAIFSFLNFSFVKKPWTSSWLKRPTSSSRRWPACPRWRWSSPVRWVLHWGALTMVRPFRLLLRTPKRRGAHPSPASSVLTIPRRPPCTQGPTAVLWVVPQDLRLSLSGGVSSPFMKISRFCSVKLLCVYFLHKLYFFKILFFEKMEVEYFFGSSVYFCFFRRICCSFLNLGAVPRIFLKSWKLFSAGLPYDIFLLNLIFSKFDFSKFDFLKKLSILTENEVEYFFWFSSIQNLFFHIYFWICFWIYFEILSVY